MKLNTKDVSASVLLMGQFIISKKFDGFLIRRMADCLAVQLDVTVTSAMYAT
jgi:hypothetical protein